MLWGDRLCNTKLVLGSNWFFFFFFFHICILRSLLLLHCGSAFWKLFFVHSVHIDRNKKAAFVAASVVVAMESCLFLVAPFLKHLSHSHYVCSCSPLIMKFFARYEQMPWHCHMKAGLLQRTLFACRDVLGGLQGRIMVELFYSGQAFDTFVCWKHRMTHGN